MNRKLGRLLEPGLELYFIVMLIFSFAALVAGAGQLAMAELIATGVLFAYYQYSKIKRRRELEAFIQSTTNTLGNTDGGRTPFPMALVRMADGALIWANDPFVDLSGFRERLHEQKITDLIPDFKMDWLAGGRKEYPFDVAVNGRRYRIYGSAIHADDSYGTLLAALYFADLTELYQVRDEYIRSRPVVSILLVDNYDELTKNLTEGAISSLNARINDAISKWTEDYHGLLRKLERNRFLFVFEKRDLNDAMEDKFSLLEDIHEIENPAGLGASMSIGIGVDGVSFEETYEFAALSIEMALSRGGDQAVVKDRYNFSFYGGRAKEADRTSKAL